MTDGKIQLHVELDGADRVCLERAQKTLKLSRSATIRMLVRAGAGEPHARAFVLAAWSQDVGQKESNG